MPEVLLRAEKRTQTGKQVAKKLRRAGQVPGVYYLHGEENLPITVAEKELTKVLLSEANLIDLALDGRKLKCVLREVQYDPVSGTPVHVDLMGIKLTEKITVEVPVRLIGIPKGVKETGGILNQQLREVEIECLPTEIPEHIDLDVSHLGIGDAIHVRDLALGTIRVLDDPDISIAVVTPPTLIKEAAEEAAPAPTEPEVIGRKREELPAEEATVEAESKVEKEKKKPE